MKIEPKLLLPLKSELLIWNKPCVDSREEVKTVLAYLIKMTLQGRDCKMTSEKFSAIASIADVALRDIDGYETPMPGHTILIGYDHKALIDKIFDVIWDAYMDDAQFLIERPAQLRQRQQPSHGPGLFSRLKQKIWNNDLPSP